MDKAPSRVQTMSQGTIPNPAFCLTSKSSVVAATLTESVPFAPAAETLDLENVPRFVPTDIGTCSVNEGRTAAAQRLTQLSELFISGQAALATNSNGTAKLGPELRLSADPLVPTQRQCLSLFSPRQPCWAEFDGPPPLMECGRTRSETNYPVVDDGRSLVGARLG